MLRLGAAEADGVITNYISPDDARKISAVANDAAKAAGKEAPDIACRIFVIATEDENAAQMIGRFIVSGYLTTPYYYAFHEWLGRGDALAPMMKAWQSGERQQAVGVVPANGGEEVFVYGSPEACRDKNRGHLENGTYTPIMNTIPTIK